MTITNPTTTGAWSALTQHKASLTPNLRAWFEQDPSRAQKFSFDAADLHVDLSKNLITEETVQLLLKLAEEVNLAERRDAMFAGEHINVTEDRAFCTPHCAAPKATPPLLLLMGRMSIAMFTPF